MMLLTKRNKFTLLLILFIALPIVYFSFSQDNHYEDQVFSDLRLEDVTIPDHSYTTVNPKRVNYSETNRTDTDIVYDLMEDIQAHVITDFTISEHTLLLLVNGAEFPVYKIELGEDKILQTTGLGNWGRGPSEFSYPNFIGLNKVEDVVPVFDMQNLRISFFALDGTEQNPFQDQFTTDIQMADFIIYENKIYANGLFFDDTSIAVLEKKDKRFSQTDTFRNAVFTIANSNFTPEVLVHLNRSSMASHPDRELLVKVHLYVPILQIFDFGGALLKEVNLDEDFDLHYRIVFDNNEKIDRFLRTPETKYAYLSVTASYDAIYALYSGRSEASTESSIERTLSDEIHIFDWEGNLVEIIRLDVEVNRLYYDFQYKQLYGITNYDNFSLVKFGSFMGL